MSTILLLKLTLAPLLVAIATIVAQRRGPGAGGLLMGLPLTTGPIFLFLAIDKGPRFAEGAAAGVLFGLAGLAAFAVAYVAASAQTGWVASLASATVAFFAASASARYLGSDVIVAGLTAWVSLLLAASLIQRQETGSSRAPLPWWNLLVRMFAVSALTLATTEAAAMLGPVPSGILGTYPVAISVVVAFTHGQFGRDPAEAMLRGCVLSWFSFANCFVVIGLSVPRLGTGAAIGFGVLAAAVTSAVSSGYALPKNFFNTRGQRS